MADVHSPATRRRNMQAIRATDTRPEVLIRKLLHARGYRYRLHSKKLPASPDIVLARYRAAILVHGCFWHGHNCHLFKVPKTRTEFWLGKIGENRRRDSRNLTELTRVGYRTLIVWECALKGRHKLAVDDLIETICQWLETGDENAEIGSATRADHWPF